MGGTRQLHLGTSAGDDPGPPAKPRESRSARKPIRYGGRGKEWHPKFVEYAERIVHHPNYRGIPGGITQDGKIRWDAPSHRPPGSVWSNLHDEREKWYREKAVELGVSLTKGWASEVAKKLHPFGHKPCQTCGREMSLAYEYPTKRTIARINRIPGLKTRLAYNEFRLITDIVHHVSDESGEAGLAALSVALGVPKTVPADEGHIVTYLQEELIPSEPRGLFSPGAMSNAPDRLDGFHSYNLCCRSEKDTGRHSDNLRTYSDDRRAFEQWCEGNWSEANRLMRLRGFGICPATNCRRRAAGPLEPDHIGPISLGFTHRARFRGLCKACNSGKNNRMDFSDVRMLLGDEEEGDQVISRHAAAIWNAKKHEVRDDEGAQKLSELMRVNQHQYLTLLGEIQRAGYDGFLRTLLHPEYAEFSYRVVGFRPTDFGFDHIVRSRRASTYAESKRNRVIRIAFEALNDYNKKKRNPILVKSPSLDRKKAELFELLKANNVSAARNALWSYMDQVAAELARHGVPRAYWGSGSDPLPPHPAVGAAKVSRL